LLKRFGLEGIAHRDLLRTAMLRPDITTIAIYLMMVLTRYLKTLLPTLDQITAQHYFKNVDDW
jgi:hypothetical protein